MIDNKPLLSIVTPCFNEEGNIEELYRRVKDVISEIKDYNFEFIVIDNSSEDDTVTILKRLAKTDPLLKIIINTRNFGHIRSPYHAILQSQGLATIYLASDLQDPPEIIPQFIKHWAEGYKLVMATKPKSEGSIFMHFLRKVYYRFLNRISNINVIKDSTGFGLYDKEVLDKLREIKDPYPFLRGLISELGYSVKTIPFTQARRIKGITKNNLYTLYDIGILGIVSHSKVPIRIAALIGLLLGFASLCVGFVFFALKLFYWNSFPLGIAPAVIGIFFLLGIQLMFIGIIGEYIGSIHNYVQKRPLVTEKERINFDS